MSLIGLNTDTGEIPLSADIVLTARPGTDLWRKPPSTNSTNAPSFVHYRPLTKFQRARVTIDGPWGGLNQGRLYDQGGLVVLISSPGPAGDQYSAWVKAGIEVFDGKPNVGIVATPKNGWSDWSLVPLNGKTATVEIMREAGGPSLYVYLVDQDDGSKKTLIREVTWVFQEILGVNPMVGIGVYAARPTKLDSEGSGGDEEELAVQLQGLEIEWEDSTEC